jgi:hypothetical protein
MSKIYRVFLMTLLGGFGVLAGAQTLQMKSSETASMFEQPGKPTRGMTQASVERDFGTPTSKQAAVGDPPISRWDYAGFVVFFEHDRVIHSVTKRK